MRILRARALGLPDVEGAGAPRDGAGERPAGHTGL